MWEVTLSCLIGALIVAIALRQFGLWSAQFLTILHLVLAIPFRSLFLATYPNAEKYILSELVADVDTFGTSLLLTMSAGIFLILSVALTKSTAHQDSPKQVKALSTTNLVILGVAVFSIYVAAISEIFGSLAGAATGFLSRTVDALEGYAYVNVLSDIFIVCCIAIFYNWRTLGEAKAKYPAVAFSFMAILTLFMSGGRGNLIQLFITFSILGYKGKKLVSRATVLAVALIFAIAMIVIPVGLGVRKSIQLRTDLKEEILSSYKEILPSLSAPFALFDHFELSKIYARTNGFDYGAQFALFPLKIIPRAIWADKPLPIAIKMRRQFFGDTLGGIPPGLPGELYISYGWLCVALIPLVLVTLINMVIYISKRSIFKGHNKFIVAMLVPYLSFNLIRGGIDIGGMRMLLVTASGLLVVTLTAKRVQK